MLLKYVCCVYTSVCALYMHAHNMCMYIMCIYSYVTLSHLRSKESTGIHKPCIPGLFSLPRVHLKDSKEKLSRDTSECTPVYTGYIPGELFL